MEEFAENSVTVKKYRQAKLIVSWPVYFYVEDLSVDEHLPYIAAYIECENGV